MVWELSFSWDLLCTCNMWCELSATFSKQEDRQFILLKWMIASLTLKRNDLPSPEYKGLPLVSNPRSSLLFDQDPLNPDGDYFPISRTSTTSNWSLSFVKQLSFHFFACLTHEAWTASKISSWRMLICVGRSSDIYIRRTNRRIVRDGCLLVACNE
jgi:hypothetical protein